MLRGEARGCGAGGGLGGAVSALRNVSVRPGTAAERRSKRPDQFHLQDCVEAPALLHPLHHTHTHTHVSLAKPYLLQPNAVALRFWFCSHSAAALHPAASIPWGASDPPPPLIALTCNLVRAHRREI